MFQNEIPIPVDSLAVDSLDTLHLNSVGYPDFNIADALKIDAGSSSELMFKEGTPRVEGEAWLLWPIFMVVVLFALLKQVFNKQLFTMIQAFFNNRVLGHLNKEESLFGAWPFLLLFVVFGFSLGLFFYQAASLMGLHLSLDGPELFMTISVLLILLFLFKILSLRFLGFFFLIQKATSEYISILSVSYFNVSMLFIPLSICLTFAPPAYKASIVLLGLALLLISFGMQALRAAFNILSVNRFSKVYLLLYFCTLEICPILILIRALGF